MQIKRTVHPRNLFYKEKILRIKIIQHCQRQSESKNYGAHKINIHTSFIHFKKLGSFHGALC